MNTYTHYITSAVKYDHPDPNLIVTKEKVKELNSVIGFNCDFVASDSQYEVKFLQHFQQEYRAELESLKQM